MKMVDSFALRGGRNGGAPGDKYTIYQEDRQEAAFHPEQKRQSDAQGGNRLGHIRGIEEWRGSTRREGWCLRRICSGTGPHHTVARVPRYRIVR